ncbi:aminoacyl-tRNA hydrolase [Acidobacteriota bacterium]
MWAVVGLGNPGRVYSRTRHNVGFMFIKKVAKDWKVRARKKMFLSKGARLERDGEKVLLAMPWTYMNNSGLAAKKIIEGLGIEADHLIVVYDDLDIPIGEIRIRNSGSAGTHRGVSSIIKEIDTSQFPRIRIGIGPLTLGMNATNFVLSPFSKETNFILKESLRKAQDALEFILAGKIEKAMNLYNLRAKTA